MSEEVSNPTAVEVESAGTDVETSSETVETTEENAPKSYQGKDRVGDALRQAKAEPIPEEMSLETLTEVEGLDEGGHKGINYNKVISDLPDDARALLSNIRADYTRKTQELAEQRRQLEHLQNSLLKGAEQLPEVGEKVELDPYDTQSFEQRIQQEVAQRLQEMMQPMREEQHRLTKRAQLDKFKAENPDLMDYKTEIAEMLKSNENISLEDAYHIVKGRALNDQNKKLKAELDSRTSRMREVGLKLSQGTSVRDIGKVPKHLKKGHEIYAWLKAQKGG
jgi:hypothetical protein|tara:strand:- start:21390 stop:22226 length:837 start_codon:yes stop_codon:yes gene_type:complete